MKELARLLAFPNRHHTARCCFLITPPPSARHPSISLLLRISGFYAAAPVSHSPRSPSPTAPSPRSLFPSPLRHVVCFTSCWHARSSTGATFQLLTASLVLSLILFHPPIRNNGRSRWRSPSSEVSSGNSPTVSFLVPRC